MIKADALCEIPRGDELQRSPELQPSPIQPTPIAISSPAKHGRDRALQHQRRQDEDEDSEDDDEVEQGRPPENLASVTREVGTGRPGGAIVTAGGGGARVLGSSSSIGVRVSLGAIADRVVGGINQVGDGDGGSDLGRRRGASTHGVGGGVERLQ